MLYGCKTWAIVREEMRRIEAFEIWCYRKMKITNEEILKRVSNSRRGREN